MYTQYYTVYTKYEDPHLHTFAETLKLILNLQQTERLRTRTLLRNFNYLK